MRLLITRPEEDAKPLAAALAEKGIDTLTQPMMTVTDTDAPDPDLDGVQALLITSANGIRAFARRNKNRDIPVIAVGDASARTARELGFSTVESARGNVETLAALVLGELAPAGGSLLHVAGSQVAGDLSGALTDAGFDVRRAVLYSARAVDGLGEEAASALRNGALDGVLLFSPRTGALFEELVRGAGLEGSLATTTAYCLSRAVADKVRGLPWADVVIAAEPNQDALLAVISNAR